MTWMCHPAAKMRLYLFSYLGISPCYPGVHCRHHLCYSTTFVYYLQRWIAKVISKKSWLLKLSHNLQSKTWIMPGRDTEVPHW